MIPARRGRGGGVFGKAGSVLGGGLDGGRRLGLGGRRTLLCLQSLGQGRKNSPLPGSVDAVWGRVGFR